MSAIKTDSHFNELHQLPPILTNYTNLLPTTAQHVICITTFKKKTKYNLKVQQNSQPRRNSMPILHSSQMNFILTLPRCTENRLCPQVTMLHMLYIQLQSS